MGGSSKKSTTPSAAATPAPQQATMTMQPFMPGMQQALADQLGAGYGQSPNDLMTYLSSIYKPMQVPDYSAKPTTTTPAPAPAPTPAASNAGKAVAGRQTGRLLPAYERNRD